MTKIEEIVKKINKTTGDTIITNGKHKPIESIPTGSLTLDAATGISGVPLGKIIELSGGEASGKTTMSLSILKEFQNKYPSKKPVFIDMEHTFDFEYAEALGIKKNKMILVKGTTGESAFDTALELIKSDEVRLVIIDSVSALVSGAEMEDSIGDHKIGMLGRLMSKGLRKLAPLADKHQTTIIFINQLREKIGGYKAMYGETRETTGGNALKFYAAMRIQFTKSKAFYNKNDKIIGHKLKFKIMKNKVGLPNEVGHIPILYAKGVAKNQELMEFATRLGIISNKGAFYYYHPSADGEAQVIGQGIVKAREYFKNNPEALKIIEDECKKELKELRKNRFKIDHEGYKEK